MKNIIEIEREFYFFSSYFTRFSHYFSLRGGGESRRMQNFETERILREILGIISIMKNIIEIKRLILFFFFLFYKILLVLFFSWRSFLLSLKNRSETRIHTDTSSVLFFFLPVSLVSLIPHHFPFHFRSIFFPLPLRSPLRSFSPSTPPVDSPAPSSTLPPSPFPSPRATR